jgi:hypothetical protein
MDDKKAISLNEIRYAERLTQRTARLYRRAATLCTFIAVLGGGGLLGSLSANAPSWLHISGVLLLAVSGAAALSVRPLEKAINNEADARKYASLRTQAVSMDSTQLQAAMQKARESDVAEIELLRDVAYNDVLTEIGREDLRTRLTKRQQLLEIMA